MEIVPDPMLVAAFLLPFLVAVVSTWFIFWRPLATWMDERDHASHHARAEAERLDKAGADKVAELEVRLGVVRGQVAELRNATRAEVAAHEKQVVSHARAEAEAKVAGATAEIAQQAEVARRGLADAARNIANDMAGQVLGRSVQN